MDEGGSREMIDLTKSKAAFEEAKKYMPGGVNSPVRSYPHMGCPPPFIQEAHGSHITDIDGNTYIDYVGSWGPMVLGHAHPAVIKAIQKAAERSTSYGAPTVMETEIAELIHEVYPSIEKMRMVNSGTEATMSALRAARGYTGRNKIVKFAGCYHGHSDALLVKAGSGVMTAGIPDSAGVPAGATQDTLTAVYNNLESVKMLFEENEGQIAAVIVEPVAANMGVVLPKEGFLKGLRELCTNHGAVLIFDEVITGFRLAFGGAQERFGIEADLVTYGKIIGAGMPVGAFGGKREIMEVIAPVGHVYQAGTLSGNPVAMAAGLTQLKILKNHPEIYTHMSQMGEKLYEGMKELVKKYGNPWKVNHIGSLGCIYFTDQDVENYEDAKTSDTEEFARYFHYMLEHGIHLGPSQFEAMFLSNAHTEETTKETLEIFEGFLKQE